LACIQIVAHAIAVFIHKTGALAGTVATVIAHTITVFVNKAGASAGTVATIVTHTVTIFIYKTGTSAGAGATVITHTITVFVNKAGAATSALHKGPLAHTPSLPSILNVVHAHTVVSTKPVIHHRAAARHNVTAGSRPLSKGHRHQEDSCYQDYCYNTSNYHPFFCLHF
jgi:hypothetical protein